MFSPIIGSKILQLSETESTNSYAVQLLTVNRPVEGSIIDTSCQTRGQGTDTNTWESEVGKNLTFSIILYPDFLRPDHQFTLNQAVALGLTDFVKQKINKHEIRVKWPNDIYTGDKKVCGILIQNSIQGNTFDYSVVGIGLNVNQTVFNSPAPNPVSLSMLSGHDYNLTELLSELCISLDFRYHQLKSGLYDVLNHDYLGSLYRINEWHNYIISGYEYKARITGITVYGQLILERETGRQWICDLKEVKFII